MMTSSKSAVYRLSPNYIWLSSLEYIWWFLKQIWFLFVIAILNKTAVNFAKQHYLLILAGIIAAVLLLIATQVIRYRKYEYLLTDEQIEIHYGIFVKQRIHIPVTRIQSISAEQGVMYQLVHLYKVKIDTSNQDEVSGQLPAITLEALNQLKQMKQTEQVILSDDKNESKPTNINSIILTKVDTKTLIKYSLTGINMVSLFAIYGVISGLFMQLIPENIRDAAVVMVAGLGFLMWTLLFIMFVIVLVFGIFIKDFNRYYQFELKKTGNNLTSRAGLLTKSEKYAKMTRFQAIGAERKLFRRLLGLSSIFAETSASFKGKDSETLGLGGKFILEPVVVFKDRWKHLTIIFDQMKLSILSDNKQNSTKPVPKTFWFNLRWNIISVLVLSTILFVFSLMLKNGNFPIWIPIIVSPVLIAWKIYATRLETTDYEMVVIENGIYVSQTKGTTNTEYYVPFTAIQGYEIHQSIWMRKKQFAHFEFTFRSGNLPVSPKIKFIKFSEANALKMVLDQYL